MAFLPGLPPLVLPPLLAFLPGLFRLVFFGGFGHLDNSVLLGVEVTVALGGGNSVALDGH